MNGIFNLFSYWRRKTVALCNSLAVARHSSQLQEMESQRAAIEIAQVNNLKKMSASFFKKGICVYSSFAYLKNGISIAFFLYSVQRDLSSVFGSSGSEDEESGEEAPERGDFSERCIGGGKERGKDEGGRSQATGVSQC